MISSSDLHWLAGLLEGEGSFGLHKHKYPKVSIAMIDEDVIQRVSSLMQKPMRSYHYPPRQRHYRVAVIGRRGAEWMMTLYRLLGKRRKIQIEIALDVWKELL